MCALVNSLEDCLNGESPFCRLDVDKEIKSTGEEEYQPLVTGPIRPMRPGINYSTNRSEVYTEFINYFGDQLFVKDKSTGQYSIYMVHIKTGLMNGSRVLVAIVDEDHTVIGNMRPLSKLNWINFQTRQLSKQVIHPPQVYPQKKGDIMNCMITRVKKTELVSTYKTEGYPLVVELQKKRNSIQEWSERNKLFVALETFQCSVTFSQ